MSYAVKNMLRAKGLAKLPIFGENEDGKEIFDFNALVPMPDTLDVDSGPIEKKAIEAAKRKLRMAGANMPIPGRKEATELEKAGLAYITNIILYGYSSWYDWRMDKWGTKWNSYDLKCVDMDTIIFSTDTNAPEQIIRALAARYPMLTIEHWWSGEEPGHYTGYREYNAEYNDDGHFADESQDAFEIFAKLWGNTGCLVKERGCWRRKDCDECDGCM